MVRIFVPWPQFLLLETEAFLQTFADMYTDTKCLTGVSVVLENEDNMGTGQRIMLYI